MEVRITFLCLDMDARGMENDIALNALEENRFYCNATGYPKIDYDWQEYHGDLTTSNPTLVLPAGSHNPGTSNIITCVTSIISNGGFS